MLRNRRALALCLVAASALSACNKPHSESSAQEASEHVPVELTAAQKLALVAELPAPSSGGDIEHGKAVFMMCKTCHTLVEGGANMTGPNLWGIFGRKAGTAKDFAYSDGLKASGITWDTARMDSWIENPRAVIAGTKMSFVGLKDAKDRIDVIAYLKSETSPAK